MFFSCYITKAGALLWTREADSHADVLQKFGLDPRSQDYWPVTFDGTSWSNPSHSTPSWLQQRCAERTQEASYIWNGLASVYEASHRRKGSRRRVNVSEDEWNDALAAFLPGYTARYPRSKVIADIGEESEMTQRGRIEVQESAGAGTPSTP